MKQVEAESGLARHGRARRGMARLGLARQGESMGTNGPQLKVIYDGL